MSAPMTVPVGGAVRGGVRVLLRVEATLLFVLSLWAYHRHGAGWGVFALCFLLPDLAFLGYLAGPRIGALAYNTTHALVGPLLLLALGIAGDARPLLAAGLIWIAHVGFDRMLGYGLKYPAGFRETHLGRIGRDRPSAQRAP